MLCKSDECKNEAVAAIVFPFAMAGAESGDTLACQQHVDAARQLMVNLGRESELQVIPLPDAPKPAPDLKIVASGGETVPETPKPPAEPAPLPGVRPTEERLAMQLRAQCLTLEITLEQERMRRVQSETELVKQTTSLVDHVIALAKEQLPSFIERLKEAVAEAHSEPFSIVDGGERAPLISAQDRATPPDPQEPASPPPPPDPDAPPHEP
jgi:hypothetical protein